MNYVNLIGTIAKEPKYIETEDGTKVANFTMLTQEPYVDRKGTPQMKKMWHRMYAWGNSIPKLQMWAKPGAGITVEGRLSQRFYQDHLGRKRVISEVEINDVELIR